MSFLFPCRSFFPCRGHCGAVSGVAELLPAARTQALLERLAIPGDGKAENEINAGDKHVGFGTEPTPLRVGPRSLGGQGQVEYPDEIGRESLRERVCQYV